MAVSLHSTASFSCLNTPTSSGLLTASRPISTAHLNAKPLKSLLRWTDNKPKRGRVVMMTYNVLRVPYKTPGERYKLWVPVEQVLLQERIVFIARHIDQNFSDVLLATLIYLDTVDHSKRMKFYISATSGNIPASLALYDTVKNLQSPVSTDCLGQCSNLPTWILTLGDKGHRSGMLNSRIMIQAPVTADYGRAEYIMNEARELRRITDYLCKELAENTGQPLEKIHKDLNPVKTFSAQEAVEYGLIDRIVRPGAAKPRNAPLRDI